MGVGWGFWGSRVSRRKILGRSIFKRKVFRKVFKTRVSGRRASSRRSVLMRTLKKEIFFFRTYSYIITENLKQLVIFHEIVRNISGSRFRCKDLL
jgi:hypothetical protein